MKRFVYMDAGPVILMAALLTYANCLAPTQSLGFNVWTDSMIDVGASDAKGALLIGSTDLPADSTIEPCLERCANTLNCNTVVRSMRSNKCALYNCGVPNMCVFTIGNHPMYSLAVHTDSDSPGLSSSTSAEPIFKFPESDGDMLIEGGDYPSPSPGELLDVCSQPQITGPCRAAFFRFAFDSALKDCHMFTYGGCRGNQNNFHTLEDCRAKCGSKTNGTKDVATEVNGMGKNHDSGLGHRGKLQHIQSKMPLEYEMHALIPLVVGLLLCGMLLLLVAVRCQVNRKRGPAKFRKMVYDDHDVARDDVVNGMFA
jgi:hypothetical protein